MSIPDGAEEPGDPAGDRAHRAGATGHEHRVAGTDRRRPGECSVGGDALGQVDRRVRQIRAERAAVRGGHQRVFTPAEHVLHELSGLEVTVRCGHHLADRGPEQGVTGTETRERGSGDTGQQSSQGREHCEPAVADQHLPGAGIRDRCLGDGQVGGPGQTRRDRGHSHLT
ncbi:hypothetical protein Ait01nite_036920 [Actinoplanes italicus]|nr:hypothetical protein [Actinoplanes italicus]GIE30647.1 hypothetical protein Ait01nite_036920 [Actinoplanes italicus]